MTEINEKTIWGSKQNHPELVVQDCKEEFGLTDEQCEKLRFILMNRGINKWLYARVKFIDLKHDVKDKLKAAPIKSEIYYLLQEINARMQNIAKMPRWVEWGKVRHKNMRQNEREIVVKGRPC
jgi:hypothetical protein